MQKKLISVIMSTRNTEEEMLRQSIESILNQTYNNFEFIIICDGTKNDYNIVKSYNDERIKIIFHEQSVGLTKSLNEAINVIKGDYIARMDSDDISSKDRFITQIQFMEKNKEIDICATLIKEFGNNDKFSSDLYNDSEGIKTQLFLYNCIAHPTIMIRRSFLVKNNIKYNEKFKYSQDYELWTRCSFITNIYIIPKVCLKYRMHNNQITTGKSKEQMELCKTIYERSLLKMEINSNVEHKTNLVYYLSGKGDETYKEAEVLNLINEILDKNRILGIYNQKKLLNTLYFKLFTLILKKEHRLISFKIILKSNIVGCSLKKMFIILKCKFLWIFRKKQF